MAQPSSSNQNSLPGIVTDQPEIFESEPSPKDDLVNDLDLMNEATDEAIALIEVPIKQAFSYFSERENEIAKFYVQRHGEYKVAGDKLEEETDIEKYHRLVSEVNELLNKFQINKATEQSDNSMSIATSGLTSNLEILSRQLKAIEHAAEDGSLDPTRSGFIGIKSKLNELKEKVVSGKEETITQTNRAATDETARLIRLSALERRLNMLESVLGSSEDKMQSLLKTTRCENLTDAVDTLSSWSLFFKPDTLHRVNTELDFLTQRLEKIEAQANDNATEQLDAQSKSKLERLYNLITSTDKHRALVPTIIHRLNAMGELQQKAAQVTTTVNYLEQTQAQIVESLQNNKSELASLTEMFAKNIDHIKDFSRDIDSRITAIREKDP